ncbi:hypothetical protein LUZ60_013051 [Juncus effusus]|nr:hypothetical protein LUZ60_013051 [Juncus effusus]
MVGQNYYNIPPPPPPPDLNHNHQSWNHPVPDRHPQYPAHNPNPTMPHSRLNMPPSLPYPNIPIRSNPHPPPSITHPRSNPDRPSSSSSSNFHPEYPTHNTYPNPPSYHPNNYFSEAGPSYLPPRGPHDFTENHFTENHCTEHHRVALKRKNPELHIPPPPSYSSPVDSRNWSYPVEDSQRNVRSRPGHLYASSHLDANNNNNNNNPAGNYGPNNATPQPFYSHPNVSALRGPERNNFSSYLPPQDRNITDPGSYNYDINHGHHHARNNTVPTMRSEPSYRPQNRNPNVPVPVTTHHSTISHSTFYENNDFAPRVEHHGARQSYVAGHASARWRHVSTDFDASSSRSRPVMFSDVSSNSGRIRNSDPSFRASFRVDRAPNRWLFEQFGSGEGPLMFDSSDFFDQHRDMRLDIDSMSYEELLALEERIGYVNAGLPDERISKCLKEFTYITCNEDESNEEQASCVICLESYEEGEEVGRLKCAHDFHTSCIKKWLQMKNACPVCKSAAFQDSS